MFAVVLDFYPDPIFQRRSERMGQVRLRYLASVAGKESSDLRLFSFCSKAYRVSEVANSAKRIYQSTGKQCSLCRWRQFRGLGSFNDLDSPIGHSDCLDKWREFMLQLLSTECSSIGWLLQLATLSPRTWIPQVFISIMLYTLNYRINTCH